MNSISEDIWATPTLMEAPYWRDGMSPIEYEIERNYWQQNFQQWISGEYMPIWIQLENRTFKQKNSSTVLTEEHLVEILESGGDIIFSFGGKHYIIIGKLCMISERYGEGNEKLFKDARQLIETYLIDGLSIKQHLDEIEILYRT